MEEAKLRARVCGGDQPRILRVQVAVRAQGESGGGGEAGAVEADLVFDGRVGGVGAGGGVELGVGAVERAAGEDEVRVGELEGKVRAGGGGGGGGGGSGGGELGDEEDDGGGGEMHVGA